MVTRTYSLAEVAAVYLPVEWKDGVRWLSRRLNRGEIQGYKVGRVWRMTEDAVRSIRRIAPKANEACSRVRGRISEARRQRYRRTARTVKASSDGVRDWRQLGAAVQ